MNKNILIIILTILVVILALGIGIVIGGKYLSSDDTDNYNEFNSDFTNDFTGSGDNVVNREVNKISNTGNTINDGLVKSKIIQEKSSGEKMQYGYFNGVEEDSSGRVFLNFNFINMTRDFGPTIENVKMNRFDSSKITQQNLLNSINLIIEGNHDDKYKKITELCSEFGCRAEFYDRQLGGADNFVRLEVDQAGEFIVENSMVNFLEDDKFGQEIDYSQDRMVNYAIFKEKILDSMIKNTTTSQGISLNFGVIVSDGVITTMKLINQQ